MQHVLGDSAGKRKLLQFACRLVGSSRISIGPRCILARHDRLVDLASEVGLCLPAASVVGDTDDSAGMNKKVQPHQRWHCQSKPWTLIDKAWDRTSSMFDMISNETWCGVSPRAPRRAGKSTCLRSNRSGHLRRGSKKQERKRTPA